jgi:gallate dioxygenase
LFQYGASLFLLGELSAVTGVLNLQRYAALCGETLTDFLKTRNAPGALYSVAAQPKTE